MIELSLRLSAVAELMGRCVTAADIGTDHGHLPVHLIQTGAAKRVIACDINPGPLARAKHTLRQTGLEDKIELRLGSGLRPLSPGEAEIISICGMGGSLIISILEDGSKTAEAAKGLVLQPQNDIPKVRHFLHRAGFRITDEKMVLDGGKFYTVLSARPGSEKYESEADYIFGRILIERKDSVLLQYAIRAAAKQERIIWELSHHSTETSEKRMAELKKLHKLYEEVLKCLQPAKI